MVPINDVNYPQKRISQLFCRINTTYIHILIWQIFQEFFLGTYYQAADTSYPGHAHEPEEMYHTLVGTTQWGESLEKLNWYGPDEFRHHPSCHPHAMVVSFSPTMCFIFDKISSKHIQKTNNLFFFFFDFHIGF